MNNIVIVEDKLKRGIALAEQFTKLAEEHPELEIEVTDICYFCANSKQAEKDIQGVNEHRFSIKHVTVLNFSDTMDKYLDSEEKHAILIMDYILDNDGSEGVPTQRVNIRYARNENRYKSNRLWFYTATGTANEQVLSTLVGKEHVLNVLKVDDSDLRLDVDNELFKKSLNAGQIVEV